MGTLKDSRGNDVRSSSGGSVGTGSSGRESNNVGSSRNSKGSRQQDQHVKDHYAHQAKAVREAQEYKDNLAKELASKKATEYNEERRSPKENAEAQKKHQQSQEAVEKMIHDNEAKYQEGLKEHQNREAVQKAYEIKKAQIGKEIQDIKDILKAKNIKEDMMSPEVQKLMKDAQADITKSPEHLESALNKMKMAAKTAEIDHQEVKIIEAKCEELNANIGVKIEAIKEYITSKVESKTQDKAVDSVGVGLLESGTPIAKGIGIGVLISNMAYGIATLGDDEVKLVKDLQKESPYSEQHPNIHLEFHTDLGLNTEESSN